MTPERQKWWESLPAEEKRVRLAIKKFETDIKWRKKHFSGGLFYTSDQQKSYIAMGKHTIKALRKQIGMCPIDRASRYDPTGLCPTCNDLVIRREHDCCAGCGQKLRWE